MITKSDILSSFKLAAFFMILIILGYCLFFLLTYTYNYWLLESYKIDFSEEMSNLLNEQKILDDKELTRSDLFPFYEIVSNPLHHYLLIIFVSIIAFFRVPPKKFEHVLLSSLLTFLFALICCYFSVHLFIVLAAPLLVWLSSYIFYRKKSFAH